MREERKKRIKRKKILKKILKFGIIFAIFLAIIIHFLNLRITQIEIIGTNNITDTEIIEAAGIKDYPKIFSPALFNIKNKISTLELVNNVKIKKNLYGKLTIIIDEASVLFYNKTNDKIVLSNQKEVQYSNKYLGIPTLINYVPEEIYKDLINGLTKITPDVLRMISEIEYSPSLTQKGEDIDNTRFLLRMNDTNTVYMNTVNIEKLNKYIEITSVNSSTRGILYLDSSIEGIGYFESYESKKKAEEEKKELEKEEAENNEGTTTSEN